MNRYFYPPLILPFFLVLIILPFLVILFVLTTPTVFQIVFNLTYDQAMLIFLFIIIGSFVNIPVYEKEGKIVVVRRTFFGLFYYTVTRRKKITIAVNIGGCIIPAILALRLLLEIPPIPWFLVFLVCSAVIYHYARPVPNMGIAVPMFIPPAISALTSYLVVLSLKMPLILTPKIAFSAGVLSSLFGADILHLKDVEKIGSGVVSIGGAGTFDGIFLTGIFSVVFSVLLI